MTTNYLLNRSQGPALSFEGDLLAETRGMADERGARYALAVYRTDDGYVVETRFWPAADAEPVMLAEFVEQLEDVEKVLYVFEPLEHLSPNYVDELTPESRQALTNRLFKLYDKEVAAIFKALGLTQPASPPAQKSATADPSR